MGQLPLPTLCRPRTSRARQARGSLGDRELAVFTLIAAEHRPGEIAKQLGISRKTIQSHCEHIKAKLDYPDCDALKRGARDLFGIGERPAQNP